MDIQLSQKPADINALDSHKHNGYELILVERGELVVLINGKAYTCSSHSLILISPLQQHKVVSFSDDYSRSYAVIDSKLLDKLLCPTLLTMLKSNFDSDKIFEFDDGTIDNIQQTFAVICNELSEGKKLSDIYIANEIVNLFITLYRNYKSQSGGCNEMVTAVQAYIDNNYQIISSIEYLCNKFSISTGHLSRLFKKYSGYSPVEYLLNVRLYNATQYLTNTKLSVQTIASNVGFCDYNNFIRTFKKRYGLPPNEFRKTQL